MDIPVPDAALFATYPLAAREAHAIHAARTAAAMYAEHDGAVVLQRVFDEATDADAEAADPSFDAGAFLADVARRPSEAKRRVLSGAAPAPPAAGRRFARGVTSLEANFWLYAQHAVYAALLHSFVFHQKLLQPAGEYKKGALFGPYVFITEPYRKYDKAKKFSVQKGPGDIGRATVAPKGEDTRFKRLLGRLRTGFGAPHDYLTDIAKYQAEATADIQTKYKGILQNPDGKGRKLEAHMMQFTMLRYVMLQHAIDHLLQMLALDSAKAALEVDTASEAHAKTSIMESTLFLILNRSFHEDGAAFRVLHGVATALLRKKLAASFYGAGAAEVLFTRAFDTALPQLALLFDEGLEGLERMRSKAGTELGQFEALTGEAEFIAFADALGKVQTKVQRTNEFWDATDRAAGPSTRLARLVEQAVGEAGAGVAAPLAPTEVHDEAKKALKSERDRLKKVIDNARTDSHDTLYPAAELEGYNYLTAAMDNAIAEATTATSTVRLIEERARDVARQSPDVSEDQALLLHLAGSWGERLGWKLNTAKSPDEQTREVLHWVLKALLKAAGAAAAPDITTAVYKGAAYRFIELKVLSFLYRLWASPQGKRFVAILYRAIPDEPTERMKKRAADLPTETRTAATAVKNVQDQFDLIAAMTKDQVEKEIAKVWPARLTYVNDPGIGFFLVSERAPLAAGVEQSIRLHASLVPVERPGARSTVDQKALKALLGYDQASMKLRPYLRYASGQGYEYVRYGIVSPAPNGFELRTWGASAGSDEKVAVREQAAAWRVILAAASSMSPEYIVLEPQFRTGSVLSKIGGVMRRTSLPAAVLDANKAGQEAVKRALGAKTPPAKVQFVDAQPKATTGTRPVLTVAHHSFSWFADPVDFNPFYLGDNFKDSGKWAHPP
jgi:hypothetical protein